MQIVYLSGSKRRCVDRNRVLSVYNFSQCCSHSFLYYIYSHNEKNSCPLCQTEGIAEEVRSYDIEAEAPDADTIENVDAFNRGQ
jgi:hypothetical protein